MTPATNPANYRTVTRNHKPCLVCVDCGRESMPGSRSLTHARNCDLAGARAGGTPPARPDGSAAKEVAEVAEVAWPAGSWQADHHPIQVMDLRGLFDLVDQLAACFGGASQVRPEHLGDAIAGRIINSNGSAPSFDDLAAWHHERWGYVVEWEDGDDERWAAAVVAAANRRLRDEARRERDVFIARLLRERDEARDEGDALARALADHLAGRPVDLTAALRRYGERGGPAFALAPR